MNEDLKRCMDNIQAAITEIKAIRDDLTIGDIYDAQKTYGLSNEAARVIFSL